MDTTVTETQVTVPAYDGTIDAVDVEAVPDMVTTTQYDITSSYQTDTLTGPQAAMLLTFAMIALVFLVVTIVGMWKIFTKAGEKGWKSLVPVYNSWTFLKMGGARRLVGCACICAYR